MVRHINTAEFEQLLAEGKTFVCDFWATWCGPCRMLAPVYEEVAKKYEGKAEFVKLDVDENGEVAAKLGIMSIPRVIVFDKGQDVDTAIGFMTEDELDEFVGKNI